MNIGGVFESDLEIEEEHIGNCETRARYLLYALFPDMIPELEVIDSDLAELSMSRWETTYDITPPAGATMSQRAEEVLGKIMATGGLNRPFFEGLAQNFGYSIGLPTIGDPHLRITDGDYPPFRAGYSSAGDPVYDGDESKTNLTWTVRGTNIESNSALQDLFNNLAPLGTVVVFTNE